MLSHLSQNLAARTMSSTTSTLMTHTLNKHSSSQTTPQPTSHHHQQQQQSLKKAENSYAVRPICFCGPSGAGKSTLLKRLFKEFPNAFAFSISHTTRSPRAGEQNGREYYFVTRDQMLKQIEQGEFLESAEFAGNMYGTSRRAVENVLATGRICALDVDLQGVKSLKKTDLNPIYCFIKPPSLEELERRLRARGTENEDSLRRRLETAARELEYAKGEINAFDHVIINDNLDFAYEKLRAVLSEQLAAVNALNNGEIDD